MKYNCFTLFNEEISLLLNRYCLLLTVNNTFNIDLSNLDLIYCFKLLKIMNMLQLNYKFVNSVK